MEFRILGRDALTNARRGELITSRGVVRTPVFMPVATRAAIRALGLRDIGEIGFDIILSNTYHLYMRPGTAVLEKAGGLHRFMSYERPILTDSGGFQVFSLSSLRKLHDHGVEFRSHIDGSRHLFTPRTVLDIQRVIGSDIMMVLDECAPYPCEQDYACNSMERSLEWAFRCKAARRSPHAALFGIVQGGTYAALRTRSAAELVRIGFDGYAIGGLSVGEPRPLMLETVAHCCRTLPDDRPRYLMGCGTPVEIVEAVARGVDMFDCVMPTRNGRNGTAFTARGKLAVKNGAFREDFRPIEEGCGCAACRHYTRAYLRHLFNAGEVLGLRLVTYHNLHFYHRLMRRIRESIAAGTFEEFRRGFIGEYQHGGESCT